MRVSLDGGVTYVDAPEGVRVSYDDQMVPGEDETDGQLLVNLTYEGIIMDLWVTKDGEDHNIGTSSEQTVDIMSRLIEDNA